MSDEAHHPENLFVSEHRRIILYRTQDVSGLSGIGLVAWGTVYPDGTVSLRWNSEHASSGFYDSIQDVIAIHGHDGATRVIWLDK